jgi:glycosyltransferase involved in cell wall biosynthesis
MYKIVDHIIVHTEKMKSELIGGFNIRNDKISVIPFGINEVIPNTNLTGTEARGMLNLEDGEKVMLFFGNIAPYKGLDQLIKALIYLKGQRKNIKLVVAGRIKQDCQVYWESVKKIIEENDLAGSIIYRIEYIPEEEAEIYFKSADVLILPYKHIFQSGVIFTAYHFGLPVVASDVGSLRDDIIEGKTGFVCRPNDPEDLARKILLYYESDVFKNLAANRKELIQYAKEKYSWEKAGDNTFALYKRLSCQND